MNFIKLIYGVVMSRKSFTLLNDFHKNKMTSKCFTILPEFLNEAYGGAIRTRVKGVEPAEVNLFVNNETNLLESIPLDQVDIIYVDEAQFLTKSQIDQLIEIAKTKRVNLFGIHETFQGKKWDTMDYIFNLNSITTEELKTTCHFDGNVATRNMKFFDSFSTKEGEKIIEIVNREVVYYPVCEECFSKEKILKN